ncbi:hypothetical protein LOAG_14463 [Loa loa]|uniref:Uncharacterized protein n=1 Tax=Loa loa TaxID=7209 RepID=A0A1S0THK3_LOALO|nr:hypothetical protein LOAG_14463 [Loa loa]EFO14061.1 hypothetical protein LOAG_14463 [Loa loa]
MRTSFDNEVQLISAMPWMTWIYSFETDNVRWYPIYVATMFPTANPCQREWIIRIPDRYVSNGAVARKTMELGEMNLEVELEDEDQECIHH